MTFSDASYGLEIKQLDGILVFKPISAQMISLLESHEEFEFVWNQNKNNDEQVLEGLYKVTSNGISENGNTVTKSITINCFFNYYKGFVHNPVRLRLQLFVNNFLPFFLCVP